MQPKLPAVHSLMDFNSLMESFEENENGDFKFKCTKFLLVDKDEHTAWIGSIEIPKKQVSLEQAISCLRRVPDTEIYPPSLPDADAVDASNFTLADDIWLKRPNIAVYNQVAGTSVIADEFLEEIAVYQRIQQNPHPNLVEFKGCLQKNGRIVGVLLRRYSMTLSTRVEGYGHAPVPIALLLEGIRAGVKHLHHLGFAHNDLNPENIVLDEQDRPVIIDMGSAKLFGSELSQMGTPDWNDGFLEVSSKVNDEIGLQKIEEWLLSCKGKIA
ncbi:hypothetical protein GCG54_00002722 [Colletotrichum gloeosporioides]|uniref:Protein kinase domain-containing protein n=1 Tax=Colletotrichum gloeosporioides TaxID=474922 RepID=A0A8H4CUA2_COLGL|nr:uncharacterized protein GCG54_00002722 [Colletotrichum gloeosporioides]KAF3810264.1 hypothetical protein GCG54_00002722 [Colletotrichum gloeosporioides]